MSLLMDALRKAEEAKKKAAQDKQSEETVESSSAEAQRNEVSIEAIKEEPSAAKVELSIDEMEETPARAPAPNLDIPLNLEDEQDYVLPSTVGVTDDSEIEPEVEAASDEQELKVVDEQKIEAAADKDESSILEPYSAPTDMEKADTERSVGEEKELEKEQEKEKSFGLDSLENENEHPIASQPVAPKSTAPDKEALNPNQPFLGTKPLAADKSNLEIGSSLNESFKSRDEPGRRSARSVFAAKKSPLLANQKILLGAAGVALVLLVAFVSYFYISLNQDDTFTAPLDNYADREFIDSGLGVAENEDIDLQDTNLIAAERDAVEISQEQEMGANSQAEELADFLNATAAVSGSTDLIALVQSEELGSTAVPINNNSITNIVSDAASETAQLNAEEIGSAVAARPATEEFVEPEVDPAPPASAAAKIEPTNLISFRRQQTVPTINPLIDRAYVAYQAGALDQAEALYREALADDLLQRDALLGLATIATRSGNTVEALDFYSRLLSRNPSDPIARAGLMEIMPAGSATEQEAELKRLVDEHPDVAALIYAHGNFLATEQRWLEAQQAYFKALQLAKSDALRGGTVNPDYAFNLAVSLEHLNQRSSALNYYREALQLATKHPAGFDLEAARNRLAAIVGVK